MKSSPLAQGEGLGVDFWDIYSSTTSPPPLALLLVTPVLEQDCCKLKFHPLMATGICFHCVNIFNASSCKSLPKPFLPSLVFSIMRFPDLQHFQGLVNTPGLCKRPWNIHKKVGVGVFLSAGNSMQVFLCSIP